MSSSNTENSNSTLNTNTVNSKSLPVMALDQIPVPNANAKRIVGLVKEKGKVAGYQLSNGETVDKEQGVTMAKQGDITGVGIASRNGNEYLKSIPDDTENNNLGNLPSVTKNESYK